MITILQVVLISLTIAAVMSMSTTNSVQAAGSLTNVKIIPTSNLATVHNTYDFIFKTATPGTIKTIYKQETGAEIKYVYYISRDEPFPSIYENADFSPRAIKDSIREGEMNTKQIVDEITKNM